MKRSILKYNEFPEEGLVFLIDKEKGWTSFNVVKKIKIDLYKQYQIKNMKVGHAGTLDPLATGLLIVCAGKMTKRINEFMEASKEYIAEIFLGATTPSFDLETGVEDEFPVDHINRKALDKVLNDFTGEQEQVPPVYSAKKLSGKKAYEYARKGKEIELKPNRIKIYELELINFEPPVVTLRILCSKGTYIRSLANDIGKALGSGAYLKELRRTAIGRFKVSHASGVDQLENAVQLI